MKTVAEWAREKNVPSWLVAAMTRKVTFAPSVVVTEEAFTQELDRLKNSTVETGV